LSTNAIGIADQLPVDLYEAGHEQDAAEFVGDLITVSRMNLDCAPLEIESQPEYAAYRLTWQAMHAAAWPNADLRDGTLALQLIECALKAPGILEKSPKSASEMYRTLALAHLRCAHWHESIDAVNKSIASAKQADRSPSGIDLLLLAMAHRQLENDVEARSWYSKAGALMDDPDSIKKDEDKRWAFFERHFRAEVDALMGKDDQKSSDPGDDKELGIKPTP
jgi:hypothetical protein